MPAPDLAAELDAMLARAGVDYPAERKQALVAAYADMRKQVDILAARYAHTDEPANIFSLPPLEAGR
jgi:hypothetical protein